ncbi:hypothetical protein L6270_01620 [Candidatus Parcubacteria bacterium]|nr:hypothetical protein [Patescibacteria group bacterium]MBU4309839.1 hypothetical protein [Patescibacteria group bacterium]MBU4431988.1 hypothetical protein [Patescibacteria group bacterium]MBU4578178.1 hypothetical protein [Patescibacteria group bacterium]MCG2696715.1 hypothetical protein [Candidatus Parcubacteria bacterium]
METLKKLLKIIYYILLYGLAAAGFVLIGGYLAVKFKITNVPGRVDLNNSYYEKAARFYEPIMERATSSDLTLSEIEKRITSLESIKKFKQVNLCKIAVLKNSYPDNAAAIADVYELKNSEVLLSKMLVAAEIRIKNNAELYKEYVACEYAPDKKIDENILVTMVSASSTNLYNWADSEEWQVIKKAIIKDEANIKKAAEIAGINPRLLVSICIVEQFRLYFTQRELYEKLFKPLSILANANKMAWGVMAIKEKTAIDIEDHLKDPSSDYYLGAAYENLLNFQSSDIAAERYARLSDEKNAYYSYLYGSLYVRQFEKQWEGAGFAIGDRPELMATLFNIGFKNSKPKNNAEAGGSELEINGLKYSFGSLAYEFFYSGEMRETFIY